MSSADFLQKTTTAASYAEINHTSNYRIFGWKGPGVVCLNIQKKATMYTEFLQFLDAT